MKTFDVAAAILLIVGALNWGLVGLLNFNLVTALFGPSMVAAAIFALVGAAGIYVSIRWLATQRNPGIVPA